MQSCMLTTDFKLAYIKLESSETYLLKLGKNLAWEFEVVYIYLKRVCTFNKIDTIFLKFHHSLLRMPKIIKIGLIASAHLKFDQI